MNEEVRVIKKYPNRRLYDTVISCYITLDDVKNLVVQKEVFRVIDAKTQDDITTSTLLQIINENEDQDSPIFTVGVLQNIIRFQDHKLKYILRRYLHQSMLFFIEHQSTLEDDLQSIIDNKSDVVTTEIAERNLAVWMDLQRQGLEEAAEKDAEASETSTEVG